MNNLRTLAGLLVFLSMLIGSIAPLPKPNALKIAGYRVLAADFHSHMFPGDGAVLAPWDVILDAKRDGLDVVALTGHNTAWTGRFGAWLGSRCKSPVVLAGEEIHTKRYHLLAIGVSETIPWRLSAADAIDAIHRQGGIAIAAHPVKKFWDGYDAAALARLDGVERIHFEALKSAQGDQELASFAARGKFAIVGDSDSHGSGPRLARTYVFVHEVSQEAVLDALRSHRTVVYDRGRYFGDDDLVAAAMKDGRLAQISPHPVNGVVAYAGAVGVVALLLLIVLGFPRPRMK